MLEKYVNEERNGEKQKKITVEIQWEEYTKKKTLKTQQINTRKETQSHRTQTLKPKSKPIEDHQANKERSPWRPKVRVPKNKTVQLLNCCFQACNCYKK